MKSWTRIPSPVGDLLVARDDDGITDLYLPSGRHLREPHDDWVRDDDAFGDIRTQLADYFAGTRTTFELPLHAGGSAWQRSVWDALVRIPWGETRSYGELARELGSPGAARAVGLANGQNPISIVVPCHRVIGASGSLSGYGGGLPAKRWLLEHEAQQIGLFAAP